MKKNKLHFFLTTIIFLLSFSCVHAQTTTLINPKLSSTFPTDSIHFSWNKLSNAFYYELNIAENASFTLNNKLIKVYNSTDTTLKNIGVCKTFYWRVRAYIPTVTAYSNTLSFSVFSPACISGLEIWMDGDYGITANGSNEISVWKDKGGKNKNAVQSLAGSFPFCVKINGFYNK
jgi:hypothetical protein